MNETCKYCDCELSQDDIDNGICWYCETELNDDNELSFDYDDSKQF